MICFTRGSLGTVLFDLAYFIGKNNISESNRIYNLHGAAGSVSHAKVNNAKLIVSNYSIKTINYPGRLKQACFRRPDFFSCIQNFFSVTNGGFESIFPRSDGACVGHVRFPDVQLDGLSRDSVDLARNESKFLKFLEERGAETIVSNRAHTICDPTVQLLNDFEKLVSAQKVVCGFSMLPLSALLFKGGPEIIQVLVGKKIHHIVRKDIEALLSAPPLRDKLFIEEVKF